MKTSLKLLLLLPLLLCTASCDQVASHSESDSGGKFTSRGPYRAFVWLRVAKQRPKIMFDVEQESHYLNDPGAQPILIRSNLVLDTALQQPGIAQLDCLKGVKDKVTWLGNRLEVGYLGNSEILQIAISGNDRDELMMILLAVRLAYMDRVVAVDREQDMRRRMTLEQAYKNTEKVITRKRIQYRTLADQLGIPRSDIDKQEKAFELERVNKMQTRRYELQDEINKLQQKMEILMTRLFGTGEDVAVARDGLRQSILEKDSVISTLKREIAENEASLEQQTQQAENPDENPEIIELRGRIEEQKQKLATRETELSPLLDEALRHIPDPPGKHLSEEAAQKIREEIEQARLDRDIYTAEYDRLMKILPPAVFDARKASASPEELGSLQREIDRLQQMYDRMGAQLEEWVIEAQAPQRVQVINEPTATKVR